MGGRLRTTLPIPIARGVLESESYDARELKTMMKNAEDKQNDLPSTLVTTWEWNRNLDQRSGKQQPVVRRPTSPRSYVLQVGDRRIRRNRVHGPEKNSPKSHTGYQRRHACEHRPAASNRARVGHAYSTAVPCWKTDWWEVRCKPLRTNEISKKSCIILAECTDRFPVHIWYWPHWGGFAQY